MTCREVWDQRALACLVRTSTQQQERGKCHGLLLAVVTPWIGPSVPLPQGSFANPHAKGVASAMGNLSPHVSERSSAHDLQQILRSTLAVWSTTLPPSPKTDHCETWNSHSNAPLPTLSESSCGNRSVQFTEYPRRPVNARKNTKIAFLDFGSACPRRILASN